MKKRAEMGTSDDRSKFFAASIDEVHSRLTEVQLTSSVPESVHTLFETAKNLSFYAWHVFEFHAVADLIGYQSLELAVRLRAEREDVNERKKTFSELISLAIELGWIVEEKMPHRLGIAKMRIEERRMIDAISRSNDSGDAILEIPPPTDSEIEAEANEMEIARSVCRAAVRLRNGLAHGRHYTIPNSAHRLKTAAALINQLFP